MLESEERAKIEGTPINLLEDIILERETALEQLAEENIAESIIQKFAVSIGLSSGVTTLDQLTQETATLFFNPVSKVMLEDKARGYVLEVIREKVIDGYCELAILSTDLDGLKQINDIYGYKGGDIAIRGFAMGTERNLIQAIKDSGKEISYAILNPRAAGSDEIKIVLIGNSLFKFVRQFIDESVIKTTPVFLTPLTEREERKVELTGGWGFYVLIRDEIHELTESSDNDLSKAGDIYATASEKAEERMSGDKVRAEAVVIHRIKSAKTIKELHDLKELILKLGGRISAIVFKEYFQREQELQK